MNITILFLTIVCILLTITVLLLLVANHSLNTRLENSLALQVKVNTTLSKSNSTIHALLEAYNDLEEATKVQINETGARTKIVARFLLENSDITPTDYNMKSIVHAMSNMPSRASLAKRLHELYDARYMRAPENSGTYNPVIVKSVD